MSLIIHQQPLSYAQRLENRCTDCIKLVVIHCTELPDLESARVWGEKQVYPQSQTGNCGHFYIDRDGRTEQWIPLNRVAHHVRGMNQLSIGIELVNIGRYPHWFQLPGLEGLAGHEDLDTGLQPSENDPAIMIRRKLDPGPCFPWSKFLDRILLNRVRFMDQ